MNKVIRYFIFLTVLVLLGMYFFSNEKQESNFPQEDDKFSKYQRELKSSSSRLEQNTPTNQNKSEAQLKAPLVDNHKFDSHQELISRLPSDIPSKLVWNDLTDFNINETLLISNHSRELAEIIEIISRSLRPISKCLKKDFCGMTRIEGDPYFDPQNTYGHNILERFLDIAVLILKDHPEFLDSFTEKELLNCLKIENKAIQIAILKILLAQNNDNMIDKILANSSNLAVDAQGEFFQTLENQASQTKATRRKFIKAIKRSLSSDDFNKMITLLENLKSLNLTEGEFQEVIKKPCRVKSIPGEAHNWNEINYYLKDYLKVRKIDLTVNQACR